MGKVDVQIIKTVEIPDERCSEDMTGDKAKTLYTEKDEQGNKFEVKCDGQLLGVFTRADGTVVYVGKCIYQWGHNFIRKKTLMTLEVEVRADGQIGHANPNKTDPEYVTPKEMQTTTWKNVEPTGDPPKTGKKGDTGSKVVGAKDIMWVYDVKTNTYLTQKTEHTGQWKKTGDGDDDWTWEVLEEKKLGDPTKPKTAPKDRKLLSLAGAPLPNHGSAPCAVYPAEMYVAYSPVPFTVIERDRPHTFFAGMRAGAREFELTRVEAFVGQPFRFHIRMPHEEDEVLAYSLIEAPTGMSVDPVMGVISWTPGDGQIGNHTVAVQHAYHGLTAHVDRFILPVLATPSKVKS
jgi:hypothetical protein